MAPKRTRNSVAHGPGDVWVDDETLLMAGIFAVAAFGGCVAIGTPVLSTALASRSWISIPIHVEALGRLPSRRWQPVDAYPPEIREQVATPTVWWGTAIVLALGLLVIGGVAGCTAMNSPAKQ